MYCKSFKDPYYHRGYNFNSYTEDYVWSARKLIENIVEKSKVDNKGLKDCLESIDKFIKELNIR